MHAYPLTPNLENLELVKRIAKSLGIGEMSMNEVDFDDLSVSESILKTLFRAVSTMVQDAQDHSEAPLINAYWIDDSRELVLCTASMAGIHLIRVPQKSWTLKPCTSH